MKITTIIVALLILLTEGVLAHTPSTPHKRVVNIRIFQTQIQDAPGVPLAGLTIYILFVPGQGPQVYKAFGLGGMENALHILPRKGLHYVVHYDGSAIWSGNVPPAPTPAQLEAFRAYCKNEGITFKISPTA